MMNFDEVNPSDINLQVQSHQYEKPSTSSATESKRKESAEPLMTPHGLLHIPQTKVEAIPKIPNGPLRHNTTSNQVSNTYSIVDDLPQSPVAMSTLEVLHHAHLKRKIY